MPWPPHMISSRRFVRLEEAFPPFGDSSEPFTQITLSNNQVYTVTPDIKHIKFIVPSGGTATVVFPAEAKYVGKVYAIQAQKSSGEEGTLKLRVRDRFLNSGKAYEFTMTTDQVLYGKTLVLMYTRYGWLFVNGMQAVAAEIT